MGVISPTLAVKNMKHTIEFYRNSFGFKEGITSRMPVTQGDIHNGYV
jgi:uncharacterized glyoxalase superfamily protein PhnB